MTAFRCRTLDRGLSTLRSDPVKAVTPDQLPVVRHHCPEGTYTFIFVASVMFSCRLFFSSTWKPRVVNTVNQSIAVLTLRILSF